jgi:putative DNA primase/helicase
MDNGIERGASFLDDAAKARLRGPLTGASALARAECQPDTGNAPAGDPASPEVLTPKPGGALSETDVTHVTDVQANNGAASRVTADAAADVTGVTPEPIIPDESKRPCFKVFDDWTPLPDGGKLKPGAWFFTVKHGKGDEPSALIQQWICSPLHVEAVTLDGQDNNFGRLLRFKTTIGKWREWAMPMDLLRGAGDELRGELLSMGVEIDPQAGRSLLAQYLQAKPPSRMVW